MFELLVAWTRASKRQGLVVLFLSQCSPVLLYYVCMLFSTLSPVFRSTPSSCCLRKKNSPPDLLITPVLLLILLLLLLFHTHTDRNTHLLVYSMQQTASISVQHSSMHRACPHP